MPKLEGFFTGFSEKEIEKLVTEVQVEPVTDVELEMEEEENEGKKKETECPKCGFRWYK